VTGAWPGEIWRRPSGRVGLLIVAGFGVAALGAPWLATHDPIAIDVLDRFAPPSWDHWLGTDQLGRDLFSRLLYGARIALGVSAAVIAISLGLGTALGIAAAYAPPLVDRAIRAGFDIVSTFPSLLFALALVAVIGPSTGSVVAVVAATFTPHFGRVARARTLALKGAAYLEADRALGASELRVITLHLLPNAMGPLVVLASMDAPVVITIEAGLSFLGVGVRPPLASWGTLLNDGYVYLTRSPWPALASGGVLCVATLGFTLLGEALRDALDPRARRSLRL
jgi:peptide/nickel transport system permease protein